jgi:hypothetical protein
MLFSNKKRFVVKKMYSFYISSPSVGYRGSGTRARYEIIDTDGELIVDLCANTRHKKNSEPLSYNKKYIKAFAEVLNHDCDYGRLDRFVNGMFPIIIKKVNNNE